MQSIGVVVKQHKMVMVALKQGVRRIYLDAYRIVPLPEESDQERQEMILHNLERFLKAYRSARDNIFIGIPRTTVLVQMPLLPAAVEENLRESVGYEIDKYTPFSYDDVYFDCHVLRRIPEAGMLQVLLITVKKQIIDEYLNLLKKIGIRPRGIEPTTTALLNAIPPRIPSEQPPEIQPPAARGPLHKAALLRLYKKTVAQHVATFIKTGASRPLLPGVDIVAESLGPSTYEIDLFDTGCLCSSEVVRIPAGDYGDVSELRMLHDRAMAAMIHLPYDPDRDNHPVRFFLSGREWDAESLERAAADLPTTPVLLHEVPVVIAPKMTDIAPSLIPELSVPIGLALKGVTGVALDVNLIPPTQRLKKKRDMRKVAAAGCGVLVMLGVVGAGIKTAVDMQRELAVLTQEVTELKKQVRSIEALQEEARKAEQLLADIARIRTGDISKIKLLEELTRIIPEDSFLTEFHYKADEKKVRLTGFSASASKLIPLLEESPLFDNVKFTSPITSDKRTGKERFRLEMNLSAGAQSAS